MSDTFTVKELRDKLGELVAAGHGEDLVFYGQQFEHIRGGILATRNTGEHTLNLSPIKLDKIGGF